MSTPLRNSRPARSLAVVLLSASVMLAACSGGNTNDDNKSADFKLTAKTPAPSGEIDSFTWSVYAEPYSLDYTHAFDYPDNQVLSNVCESLLRWNADLSVSPGLAEKWDNPTPTTWVYSIRPGVTFHDGSALTAADVVASLNRHLDEKVGSFWATSFANVASVKETGDLEVKVTTKIPDAEFNQAMAAAPGVVESAATLAKGGADYGNARTGVNCTGPFSFDSWDAGKSITFKRYDDYWDKDLRAKSKQVKFVFLADPNTRINAFKSGEVDGGWLVPSNAIDSLSKAKNGKVYFGVNTTVINEVVSDMTGPMGDVRVRRALMMAIDRPALVAAAEQGYARPTTAMTDHSLWKGQGTKESAGAAFEGLDDYALDVNAAKKLVDEAGATGEEIVIGTSKLSAGTDVVAQAVAAAATSIGLKPRINTIAPDKYTTLFTDPDARKGIDLFYTMWNLTTGDPLEMYAVLRTGEFSNYGNWSNPEFDSIVNKAIGMHDPAERAKETAKAQVLANKELPWLPLYEIPTTAWIGSKITGVAPSINYMFYPWAATIGAR